jgi:hypothetical protein
MGYEDGGRFQDSRLGMEWHMAQYTVLSHLSLFVVTSSARQEGCCPLGCISFTASLSLSLAHRSYSPSNIDPHAQLESRVKERS